MSGSPNPLDTQQPLSYTQHPFSREWIIHNIGVADGGTVIGGTGQLKKIQHRKGVHTWNNII